LGAANSRRRNAGAEDRDRPLEGGRCRPGAIGRSGAHHRPRVQTAHPGRISTVRNVTTRWVRQIIRGRVLLCTLAAAKRARCPLSREGSKAWEGALAKCAKRWLTEKTSMRSAMV
jgi:hypothetical protein